MAQSVLDAGIGCMAITSFVIVSFFLSFMFTSIWRKYAIKNRVIDIPNQRSSHSVPTPRGGGVAIVLVSLMGVSILYAIHAISLKLYLALMGAGGLSAIIGYFDDRKHIQVRWRLLSHLICAVWALTCLGGLPAISLFGQIINLGWFGNAITIIYMVWLLNLYNFMDGIDGIAGVEAITVCLSAAILLNITMTQNTDYVLTLIIAGTVSGFLVWNFPRAKIFMGDSGSGFLGLILAILSISSAWIDPSLFWGWLILLGVFIVDATITLLRRMTNGEKIYEAHRSHAYQHAAQIYGSHTKVTMVVGLINMMWLFPIALMVVSGRLDGLAGVTLSYLPLIWSAIRFNAGVSIGNS